jgi:hypothetical protein
MHIAALPVPVSVAFTPVNMTVIRLTPAGMLVKSIEVPEVLACAVARVTREAGAVDAQADPVEVSTLPLVLAEVIPVPPFAAISVPARVTAPVVPVEGVNPVVPAEKEETEEVAAEVQAVPLEVRTLPEVLGATEVNPVPPEFPTITLLAVTVADPVPPDVTARGVVRVMDPALKAAK